MKRLLSSSNIVSRRSHHVPFSKCSLVQNSPCNLSNKLNISSKPIQPLLQFKRFKSTSSVEEYGQPPKVVNSGPQVQFQIIKDGEIPPNIDALATSITKLDMIELKLLSDSLAQKLGMPKDWADRMGGMSMMGGMQMGGGQPVAQQAAPAAAAPKDEPKKEEEPVKKEKEVYTVKLIKVPEDVKYKVLKEIRVLRPGMTITESKKFVENLPSILKEAVPKDEAHKWEAKLKEAGGEVKLE